MKKILVGVDLSPESELALGHAIELARKTGAELVLAMVDCIPELPANLAPAARDVALSYTQELERRLAADRVALGELRARHAGAGPGLSQLIADGFADEEVPRMATEVGAELIVVGSRGRTGLRRWLLGSVAEGVVRRAEQPVLVARGEAVPGGYRRVVIGTDLGPLAELALERALPLLADDARIDLVHAWQLPWAGTMDVPVVAMPHEELRRELTAALERAARQLEARLRDRGRPAAAVHVHLVQGSAAHALTARAADEAADLVVVGSHGRRGVRRFVLGSVAEATVRHAPCAVLVGR